MKWFLTGGALAASLVLAVPAQAQSLEDLDCVLAGAPAGLADNILQDFLIASDVVEGDRPDVRSPLAVLATQCAATLGMGEQTLPLYSLMALSRLGAVGARARLVDAGVDMAHFDELLEVEWGEGALTPPEWTPEIEGEVTATIEALEGTEVSASSLLANYLVFYAFMTEQGSVVAGQLAE